MVATDSWDKVFLTLRAVRRAGGLAYQHSRISFPITRRAWQRVSSERQTHNVTDANQDSMTRHSEQTSLLRSLITATRKLQHWTFFLLTIRQLLLF